MLKQGFIILLLVNTFSANAHPAKVWTLDECIRYAEEHSLDLRKHSLSYESDHVTLQESRWAFVPSISASSNYAVSSGRVLDPTTYQFVETNFTGNSSSSISGDISIFEGGRKLFALKKAKLSLRASLLKEESIKYNIKLNVIAAYIDVVCAKEQTEVALRSASLVKSRLGQSKVLLEAGNITESDVLQLQVQLYAAQNDIASTEQSLQLAKLALCDLLEIDDYASFEVELPEDSDVRTMLLDVETSIENHPDYQLSLLNQKISRNDLCIARSSLFPSLSLSAGYGSSFSDARMKVLTNRDGTIKYEAYPFFRQYADNASVYVSAGLKIPILSGLSTRNSVKRAKIAITESQLATLEVRKQIRRTVIQAQMDCNAAWNRYLRAKEEVRYAEEAYRQIDEKYNFGATDFLSWNTAFVELAKARYSLAESKYTYILKLEILKIY